MTEYGHNLVMTSSHFGARPEHEVWQGRAFSLAGREVIDGVTYPDFYKATGYGTVSGMQGVNCRHSWGPYYPGISKLPNIEDTRNGMTSEQYYKATQKQRSLERSIRDKKRDIDLYDKAGLDTTQLRLELGHKQRQLKNFVDDKQLVRDPRREKAYGIGVQPRALKKGVESSRLFVVERMGGVGEASNAVVWNKVNSAEYRRKFDALTDNADVNALVHQEALRMLNHRNNSNFEDISIVNNTKRSLLGRSTNAKVESQVHYTERIKQSIDGARKRGDELIAIHNHPNSFPPSSNDIFSLKTKGYAKSVVTCHSGEVFVIDGVGPFYTQGLFGSTLAKMRERGYTEYNATLETCKRLEKECGLKWRLL